MYNFDNTTNGKFHNEILNLIKIDVRHYKVRLKKQYPEFYNKLEKLYPDIPLISERVYLFFHNGEKGKCVICGKPTKFYNYEKGYNKYCCNKCIGADKSLYDKAKGTINNDYNIDIDEETFNKYDKNRTEMIELINKLMNIKASLCYTTIRFHHPDFYTFLYKKYSANIKFKEMIYKYCHNDIIIYCETCGKPTKFKSFKLGYCKHCSSKCSANNEKTKIKKENTVEKIYGKGIKSVLNSDKVKEKIKQTNLKKYGVEYTFQSPDIINKCKKRG